MASRRLRERQVGGVIGRHVVAQFPDPVGRSFRGSRQASAVTTAMTAIKAMSM